MKFEFEERDYWKYERNNAQYLVIEKYKDYELTECLAFEMARRTQKGRFQIYLANKINKQHELTHLLPPLHSKIMKELQNEDSEKMHCFYLDDVSWHPFDIIKWFKRVPIYKNAPDFEEAIISIKKGIINFKEKHRTIKRELFPTFTCPIPAIRKDISKEVDITLNLALPKEELLAYVAAIKDNYDKDHTTISFDREVEPSDAINELKPRGFGKKLEVPNMKKRLYADMFFVYDCLNTKDGKEHRNEAIQYVMSELEKYYSEILADDIINKSHKERIGDEKFKERLKEKLKADYILGRTPRTIKKYNELMCTFIDNERYKELLTGEKVK